MFRKNWDYRPTGLRADARLDMLDCLEACGPGEKGNFATLGFQTKALGAHRNGWLVRGSRIAACGNDSNEYSLLCRLYDTDLGELSVAEDVGLIGFSLLPGF